ncbi:hypothetical protein DXM27_23905 [Rhizobium rhizogenes]|uniref:Uncharacterized protein n=1 Tax=Rhizobium rhizogenes TaxID=359 RepID=A0AA88EX03_RHIRH|nr:hypothetical protein DXM27_23905 [Rhizobium rhizogenes]
MSISVMHGGQSMNSALRLLLDAIFPPPSFLCLSQESSRRVSTRRVSLFSPRTWAGWFPVTSTGMRAAGV